MRAILLADGHCRFVVPVRARTRNPPGTQCIQGPTGTPARHPPNTIRPAHHAQATCVSNHRALTDRPKTRMCPEEYSRVSARATRQIVLGLRTYVCHRWHGKGRGCNQPMPQDRLQPLTERRLFCDLSQCASTSSSRSWRVRSSSNTCCIRDTQECRHRAVLIANCCRKNSQSALHAQWCRNAKTHGISRAAC